MGICGGFGADGAFALAASGGLEVSFLLPGSRHGVLAVMPCVVGFHLSFLSLGLSVTTWLFGYCGASIELPAAVVPELE